MSPSQLRNRNGWNLTRVCDRYDIFSYNFEKKAKKNVNNISFEDYISSLYDIANLKLRKSLRDGKEILVRLGSVRFQGLCHGFKKDAL